MESESATLVLILVQVACDKHGKAEKCGAEQRSTGNSETAGKHEKSGIHTESTISLGRETHGVSYPPH